MQEHKTLAFPPTQTNSMPSKIDPNERIARKKLSAMEWLERRTQPYIVWAMLIAAAARTVYTFTDHLVDITKFGTMNYGINVLTGLALALISDLTIVIAGRRGKLYKKDLFAAKMAQAQARKAQAAMWAVEVKRLDEQVASNKMAMWVAMGMSVYASASYLITSTSATGALPMIGASALGAYVLYLAYFHSVQTDEMKEDGTQEVAEQISEQLNMIRVEEIARIRGEFSAGQTAMSVPARLALIAGGLSVPDQRRVMPTLGLLLRSGDTIDAPEDEDLTGWYSVREIAIMIRDAVLSKAKFESIMRNVRHRLDSNAEKHPDAIRYLSGQGWMVESAFAIEFFNLPAPIDEERIVESDIIDS